MQITFYKKPTDSQNYLHAKSAHPLSLKKSISYSQALRIKHVSSTFDKYKKDSNEFDKRLVEKGYKEKKIIRNQIEKVDNLEKSTLLNKTNAVRKNVIPFSVTYSPILPNIREIINKHWHILNINNTFGNVFKATPVIAFRKNTSLKGALSGLRQFLATRSSLKMMKNALYFTSKALFVLKIFMFFLDFLVMYQNGLIKKIRLISNFMTSQSG